MSFRTLILLGVVAAALVTTVTLWPDKQNESKIQAEMSRLVAAYDDAIYMKGDRKVAKELANEIKSLASESDDSQAVEVRGAIRVFFADVAFGKWEKGWPEKVESLSKFVSEEPSVARAEFLVYSGLLKGKWQRKFEEGLKETQEAISIAQQIKDDHALTLGHLHASELNGFQNQANLAAMNSYRAVTVAEHLGQKSLIAKTLRNLTEKLVYFENIPEAGEVAKRCLELDPDSMIALYAISLADKTDRRFEQYVQDKFDELSSRPDSDQPLGCHKAAKYGGMLQCLGFCYFRHGDFSKCREFMQLAMPKLKACNNKFSIDCCKNVLQLASLEEATDVNELDEFANGFDPNADFPQIGFAESLGAAYLNLGEKEKSLHWREVAWDLQEKNKTAELGYLKKSSETYWKTELRAREQQEITSKIAAASNLRIWLLSMAMGLCGFLAVSSFLVRRERNSLEDIVETRTKSLSKAMDDANSADRAKSDFLAQINHEIRNPLSAILGYCDLLSSGKGESHQLVAGIKSSSHHLRELVDKILEVSKIESNGVQANDAEFYPEQTVNDINEIMAEQAVEKGFKFECIFNGDHQCTVLSDETKIRQIALNLIGNAFKFTEQGNVLASFDLREQDDLSGNAELVIAVKDSGIGIAENETKIIFDRFTKASNATTHDGSGLGLFIISQLIECLNGKIELSSVLGVGTQVQVTIPLKVSKRPIIDSDSANPQDAIVTTPPLANSGKRVLVVDDQEMIRTTVRLLLTACGLQCKTTEALEDTIEIVENWQPDLVLLDLRMPKHSGFEVLEQIRQSKHFNVPVYAMTGDATLQMQQKCIGLGFDGFITKPFEISSITRILQPEAQSLQAANTKQHWY